MSLLAAGANHAVASRGGAPVCRVVAGRPILSVYGDQLSPTASPALGLGYELEDGNEDERDSDAALEADESTT